MIIELVNIDDLDLDSRNARKHDAKNLKAIADSLEQFGQRKPIVVWGRTVVAGNGTMAAARSLGWKEISVARVPDDWRADQVKAYALADNRSAELAEWDEQVLASQLLELQQAEFDIELLGFELPVEELAEVVEDEIPEQVEPKAKLGDVWQLGKHRLLCGDATDTATIEKLMNGTKADLVLTDPPFGNGVTGANRYGRSEIGNNKNATRTILGDSNTDVIKNIFQPIDKVLADDSHCLVWIQWRTFSILENTFKNYRLKTVVVWDKKSQGLGEGIVEQYEMLCVFIKGKAKQNAYTGNVWSISREHSKRTEMEHPHKKPIEVLVKALDLTSQRKDNVLDLFGGSGSTLIACEQTDRTCFMMELDPKYVDVIIARWEKLTGEQAQLIEG
jgi:site-specific DNA-methyltransferase (adenine-specific)